TTTPIGGCGSGCWWQWLTDTWIFTSLDCSYPCTCDMPIGSGTDCVFVHTDCHTIVTTSTTGGPLCGGSCGWMWQEYPPPLTGGTWVQTGDSCNSGQVAGCDCQPPSVDGDKCFGIAYTICV